MKKTTLSRSIVAMAATAFSCIATATVRPNIIVIYMDDMGYNDVGAINYPGPPTGPASMPVAPGNPIDPDFPAPNVARLMTPNIDSLATDGLLMPQFYGVTLCSPSRSSLMTGRYCKRLGVNQVFSPSGSGDAIKGLNTAEVTLPEILRENGYATGMVGKWHLGYVPTAHDPFQMMPTRHGFQEFFGHPHSNDMTFFSLIRNEAIIDPDFSGATKQAEITWRYTEAALDFIQRKSGENKPFFLYLAPVMTHAPCWPSDRTFTNADGTTWPKFQGTSGVSYYYDVVKETDHCVGRVLKKLDELGIDDDTLVIFTSDNGPWLNIGNYKGSTTPNLTDISVGSAYPLREGKFTTWEGGVRVPFLARWKGKIPAGTVLTGQVGAMTDLLPTLVGLAGAPLPAGRIIDGKDLWPLWSGQTSSISRSYAHFHWGNIEAVVKGQWKLRSNNTLHDVWNLNDQETTDHAAAQPAIVADLQAERTAIAASIAAETVPLGVFTSYQVLSSTADLTVIEGATASFTVVLSADPGKVVNVSASRFSGDADLSVSAGTSLVFNSSNWSIPQTVTVTAAADADANASGATFRITTNDIPLVREVFVSEKDTNAAPPMETSLVWPKVDPVLIAGAGVKLVAEGSSSLGAVANPSAASYFWTKVSGPGNVSFTTPAAAETGVAFSMNGSYRLRLTASHPDASLPGVSEFSLTVGATASSGGLKHSPPLVYDATQDTDGNLVWKNLISPGTGDVTLDSGVSPNVVGNQIQSATVDFDPASEFAAQFTGGAYTANATGGLSSSNGLTLINPGNTSVTSLTGSQAISLPANGFVNGSSVTVGVYFKLSAFGTATAVAGQILRLGLTNGGTDNFADLPSATIELTNATTGAAKLVFRESNQGLPAFSGFDLDLNTWYYFESSFTRITAGTINLAMSIFPSDASGVLGTAITSGTATGVSSGITAAEMDKAIFGGFKGHQAFSNGAAGVLDNFFVRTTAPVSGVDPAPALSFINSAVVFPGGSPLKGGSSPTLDSYSNGDATFSLWFKPNTLPSPSRQVIWETGGDIGTSFILDGSSLKFVVDDGASNLVKGATASATLAPSVAQNGFIHACGVIDLASDQIHLYIDGVLVSTEAIPTVTDWCGLSGTGFGRFNTTGDEQELGGNDQLTSSIDGYAGMLAMVRFYNQALSSAAITSLHADPLALETGSNIGPEVSAGIDQSTAFTNLAYTVPAILAGSASDDGKPLNSTLSLLWQTVAGPGAPEFTNATQAATTATFALPGTYQLWLVADDSEIKVFDEMSVTISPLTYASWAAGIAFAPGENDANADPDHDNFDNLWEWALGFDPLQSTPTQPGMAFTSQPTESGQRLTLEFQVPYNRQPNIFFQHSDNLQAWQTIVTPDLTILPSTDTHASWTLNYDIPDTDSHKFIRSAVSE